MAGAPATTDTLAPDDIIAQAQAKRQGGDWLGAIQLLENQGSLDLDGVLLGELAGCLIDFAKAEPVAAEHEARSRGEQMAFPNRQAHVLTRLRARNSNLALALLDHFVVLRLSPPTGQEVETAPVEAAVADLATGLAAVANAADFAALGPLSLKSAPIPDAFSHLVAALDRALHDPQGQNLPISCLGLIGSVVADRPMSGARSVALMGFKRLAEKRQELIGLHDPLRSPHLRLRIGYALTLLLLESVLFGRSQALRMMLERMFGTLGFVSTIGFLLRVHGVFSNMAIRDWRDIGSAIESDPRFILTKIRMLDFHASTPRAWNLEVFENVAMPTLSRLVRAGKYTGARSLIDTMVWTIQMQPHTEEQWRTVGDRYLAPVFKAAEELTEKHRHLPLAPLPRPGEKIRVAWITDKQLEYSVPMILTSRLMWDVLAVHPGQFEFFVYSVSGTSPEEPESFNNETVERHMKERGIHPRVLRWSDANQPDGVTGGATALRRAFAEEGIHVAITFRTHAVFDAVYSAVRVAPVQVYWPMAYDWPAFPKMDGFLTIIPGPERDKTIDGRKWNFLRFSFLPSNNIDPDALAKVKDSFAGFWPILGTIARPEKLNSEPFIAALARILERFPNALYVWSGYEPNADVVQMMRQYGITERCRFLGWVPGYLYNAAIDMFLDTFPYGNGQSAVEAMCAGKPLISYDMEQSVYGYVLEPMRNGWYGPEWQAKLEELETGPSGNRYHPMARSPDEYVDLAVSLIEDPVRYAEAGAASRKVASEILINTKMAADTFRDAILDIVDRVRTSGGAA
jgi:glycosyltransferase involved in cell wall biosynthesis